MKIVAFVLLGGLATMTEQCKSSRVFWQDCVPVSSLSVTQGCESGGMERNSTPRFGFSGIRLKEGDKRGAVPGQAHYLTT